MQFYPQYFPESEEVCMQFVATQKHCLVQTMDEGSEWHNGAFNPLYQDGYLYFHFHRADPQVAHLKKNPNCKVAFFDYSGFVPSYAKSPTDASFASMFYRFAELKCEASEVREEIQSAKILDSMMDRYQPEGGFERLVDHLEKYQKSLKIITVWRCRIVDARAKWKLGQNRTPAEQLRAWSLIRR